MVSEPISAAVSAPLKARPIFISSTFRDMHAERDYLRHQVFPRLEEQLRKNRHQLDPIDLRLGVEPAQTESEESRELIVLKVCLNEIKRSRPFLIVLLGDRYGWVPPEERIATAAQEQGFQTDTKGKSVTALEIEFGILKEDKDQQRRNFFFFRNPLPYDRMPESVRADYSDAYSNDPQVRRGYDQLTALKTKLENDPELKSHVFEYTAVWDNNTNRVTGLEDFGNLVYERPWKALQEETAAYAAQPPATWQQQEHQSLAEFIENRSRNFTGRQQLLKQLLDLAHSPAAENTSWGACITGAAGSGKSALFAELFQKLQSDNSVLVLANAAGGTIRGASVDSMLRRWIDQLSGFLKITNPLPEKASSDDVDTVFLSLLHRTSAQKRVVLLLDALDQFEPLPRAQYLTWLKNRQWPANVGIIATAIPCVTSETLSQWGGIEKIKLPPLELSDAEQIARKIKARYHQPFDAQVLQVLTDKRLDDGQPAFGNPLWLTLALEQLSLLDADDFGRIDTEFTGTPSQRLHALMLDIASRMPADVEGLYGWLLAQTEKVFGVAHARAFTVTITLSRHGWRDSDLLAMIPPLAKLLLPQESVPPLDDLKLAALRRGFRTHLTRRGIMKQLDFFHAQMRWTVQARTLKDTALVKKLHSAIADYLEGLPDSDVLRESELMVHLIDADQPARASQVYANLNTPFGEKNGATLALTQFIMQGIKQYPNPNLDWIISLLHQPNLTNQQTANLVKRFNFDLNDSLENIASLPTRHKLLGAARQSITKLAQENPTNATWQRDLSLSLNNVGDVLLAQGDPAGALKAHREAQTISQRLVQADPSNATWQRDLNDSLIKVGDVLQAQGDLAGTLNAYREAQAILQRLVQADSSNAGWQRDLGNCLNKVGEVLLAQGDLAGVLNVRRESLDIGYWLAQANPSNIGCEQDLFVRMCKVCEVLQAQGDPAEWIKGFQDLLDICMRLAQTDLTNSRLQRDLSVIINHVGDVLKKQGDLAGALKVYRETQTILQRLVHIYPTNAGLQRDLSVSQERVGEVLLAQGDLASALKAYGESLDTAKRLAQTDPTNAEWQRDLWVIYLKMADICYTTGSDEAMDWWRRAYEQLSVMKKRGLFISPHDEQVLQSLHNMLTLPKTEQALYQPEITPSKPSSSIKVDIPSPHSAANPDRASQLNIQYQKDLKAWEGLPWLKRIRTKRPEPPKGI